MFNFLNFPIIWKVYYIWKLFTHSTEFVTSVIILRRCIQITSATNQNSDDFPQNVWALAEHFCKKDTDIMRVISVQCTKTQTNKQTLKFKIVLYIWDVWGSYIADPSGRLVAGVAGSNPAEGMNICILCFMSYCRM
jgi:hypothetical protein